jgi:hypothetical protein
MGPLAGIFRQQRQKEHNNRPFLIGNVGRVKFAGSGIPQPSGNMVYQFLTASRRDFRRG